MTLLLLTTRLVVAFPGVAPPMRKNTSLNVEGSDASLSLRARPLPTWRRTGELTGPASKRTPEIMIPFARAVVMAALPLVGTSVGKPRPSTTVSGRVTSMLWSRWYTPGVRRRFRPAWSAALIVDTESTGVAT
jgi:hypothetical protein